MCCKRYIRQDQGWKGTGTVSGIWCWTGKQCNFGLGGERGGGKVERGDGRGGEGLSVGLWGRAGVVVIVTVTREECRGGGGKRE